MVFSSVVFLLFFMPCFFALYYLVPRSLKNYAALGGSVLFYAWGAPLFVFVVGAQVFVTFHLVRWMHREKKEPRRKWLLGISIGLNLALLLYFKYANFFVENLNEVLYAVGIGQWEWTKVALPIGISFFTFQTLTYCVDVYRKLHEPLHRYSDLLLYALVFPQLIAGPIVRFTLIADELTERSHTTHQFLTGFFRFTIGLAKKVLIANTLGAHASGVFDTDISSISSPEAWIAITAYTFQIYFDFAGYSDMAIGLGRMMGFHFPENFNNPYLSRSISEFWKRWHMTLSSWMRDYLYIPLGGNRVKTKSRLYFNLIVVFLISGLWHGASWNFVIWGGFHGGFLILDRIFLLKVLERIGAIPATVITFLVVLHGWVFFRIENFSGAVSFLEKMYSFQARQIPGDGNYHFLFILLMAVLFSFIAAFTAGKKIERWVFDASRSMKAKDYILQSLLACILFIICLSGIAAGGFNPFIYFRF